MRQIVLDTETTGLEPSQGHRIIEIGCVEVVDRKLTGNNYHQYINPQREIDEGAIEVHGITNEFLADKPLFVDIAQDFLEFIHGAQLVIHNAAFDVGFIDHEFALLGGGYKKVADYCSVIDTLEMARQLHPGQKNNLDALCRRYDVDNAHRELHGALLDSEILADVYLRMTGGQTALLLDESSGDEAAMETEVIPVSLHRSPLSVIRPNEQELLNHQNNLAAIDKSSGGACLWLRSDVAVETCD